MSEQRLIDANKLKEDFQDRLRKARNWKENALNNGDDEIVIRADATIGFICEVIMTIDNAPTVEPICPYLSDDEVKRPCLQAPCDRQKGEWIELQRGIHVTDYKCSCCGRTVRDDTGYDVSKDYPFCHCGADMRGDENG